MKVFKNIIVILAVLLILAGGAFFLQGMNVITVRSFMRNNPDWMWYGGAMVVVGVVLLVFVNRMRISKTVKRVATILLTVVGILVVLMGLVWFLQGINILPGSRMTGQIQWAINGGIAIVVGVVMIAIANWKRLRRRR